MKKLKIISLSTAAVVMLFSCEKIIDIELEESDRQIVVEAQLQEGNNIFTVLITKTAPYFDNQEPESISNAVVKLMDDEGSSFDIPLTGNGEYSAKINAAANKTYFLQVQIDNQIYEASSFLPGKVNLKDVYAEFEESNAFRDEGYTVYFEYNDPALELNFYRVIYYLNGEAQLTGEDIQVWNDSRTNGNRVKRPLFRKIFDPGDHVKVELVHFDEPSHDYFNSLGDITGEGRGPSGGSAAPGNPISNWSGGILGYFSAYSPDTLSVNIP